MKKSLLRLTSISLVVILLLVALPTSVFAFNGQWNTGTATTIDYKANPTPTWLQIFSDGVKTDAAATICYPFPKGLEEWVGNIYQLKDQKWIKLATTTKWMPNTEGTYTACANTTEAGTFVLMGYYHSKVSATPVVDLSLRGDWNTGTQVDIDPERTPPPSYLQLFFAGVKADKNTKICHAFPAGPFGWTPEIRQWKNGAWVKLVTSAGFVGAVNDNVYTACATTTEAGTFGLFGYWHK